MNLQEVDAVTLDGDGCFISLSRALYMADEKNVALMSWAITNMAGSTIAIRLTRLRQKRNIRLTNGRIVNLCRYGWFTG